MLMHLSFKQTSHGVHASQGLHTVAFQAPPLVSHCLRGIDVLGQVLFPDKINWYSSISKIVFFKNGVQG